MPLSWRMFIDDERFPSDKDSDFVIVRNVGEAVEKIKENGSPTFISFDHDLGENEKTGFDFAKWLVETDLDKDGAFLPDNFSFYVHSANPVGKKNIEGLLNQYLSCKLENTKKMKI